MTIGEREAEECIMSHKAEVETTISRSGSNSESSSLLSLPTGTSNLNDLSYHRLSLSFLLPLLGLALTYTAQPLALHLSGFFRLEFQIHLKPTNPIPYYRETTISLELSVPMSCHPTTLLQLRGQLPPASRGQCLSVNL